MFALVCVYVMRHYIALICVYVMRHYVALVCVYVMGHGVADKGNFNMVMQREINILVKFLFE